MTTSNPPEGVDVLTEEQCWNALAGVDVGRLAIRTHDDIDLFPVNFLIAERRIYFRTAPGTKMIELTAEPRVAFEADGGDACKRWSVTVKGTAERLKYDTDIEQSGIQGLHSLDPASKWNYVRITPQSISGRRFEPVPAERKRR
jgi:nitroimidazol reductase NimA-like FMN-containing flavoprotein (pyridoxamine 5'-phosphate oxidase superfamily)